MRLLTALSVLILVGVAGFAGTSFGSLAFQHGDVDCDKDVDSVDGLRILQDVAGLKSLPSGCSAEPTPVPTAAGAATTFGSGIHAVGTDIAPGTYRNSDSSSFCYWERLSGFSGTLDDIIANEFSDYRQVVTISASDVGFSSDDCGTWAPLAGAITASQSAPFGDGVWVVGTDIAAGTWRNEGSTGCYWQRSSGFGGTLGEIIANEFTDDQQIVTIEASDVGFESSGCGTWTKIS